MTTATVIPIRREFQVHRFDPIKHGVLAKHIALPWEDRDEFEDILRGLLLEHAPQGPTAYHLVEDLAGVIWRKRRLLQAEGAAIREKLYRVTQGYENEKVGHYALAHKAGSTNARITDIVADRLPCPQDLYRERATIDNAEAILAGGQSRAFQKALDSLSDELRACWEDEASDANEDGEEGYSRNAEGLTAFLQEARAWYNNQIRDSATAPIVKDQAHGMAIDLRDLEAITKIEAHLDRKMQALLAELRKLGESNKPAQ